MNCSWQRSLFGNKNILELEMMLVDSVELLSAIQTYPAKRKFILSDFCLHLQDISMMIPNLIQYLRVLHVVSKI